MVRRVVILVQGRTCAGKSTLVGVLSKALANNVKDLYVLPYDLIKTGLMGYQRDKHAPLVKQLTLGISEVMFSKRLSVLVEMNFGSRYEYDRYIRTARRYRYAVVPINLVAPLNVLLERFRTRISAYKKEGRNTSGMDERLYLKGLAKKGHLAKHSHSFDTSGKSVEEIAREVIEIVTSLDHPASAARGHERPAHQHPPPESRRAARRPRNRFRPDGGRAPRTEFVRRHVLASSTLSGYRQADVNAGESQAGK